MIGLGYLTGGSATAVGTKLLGARLVLLQTTPISPERRTGKMSPSLGHPGSLRLDLDSVLHWSVSNGVKNQVQGMKNESCAHTVYASGLIDCFGFYSDDQRHDRSHRFDYLTVNKRSHSKLCLEKIVWIY